MLSTLFLSIVIYLGEGGRGGLAHISKVHVWSIYKLEHCIFFYRIRVMADGEFPQVKSTLVWRGEVSFID